MRGERTIVCKHWLRHLCKKGDDCEFLHEYDMTKMPICYFFQKFGECNNKDCQYLHIDAESLKVRECPWYDRGFCKHGRHTDRCAFLCRVQQSLSQVQTVEIGILVVFCVRIICVGSALMDSNANLFSELSLLKLIEPTNIHCLFICSAKFETPVAANIMNMPVCWSVLAYAYFITIVVFRVCLLPFLLSGCHLHSHLPPVSHPSFQLSCADPWTKSHASRCVDDCSLSY